MRGTPMSDWITRSPLCPECSKCLCPACLTHDRSAWFCPRCGDWTTHTAESDRQTRGRSLPPLIVDSGLIPIKAGSSSRLATWSSVPVCITKFSVASSVASFFNINISIGRFILAGRSGVPAADYIPDSEALSFEAFHLPVGSEVVVVVENLDVSSHRFRGAFSCREMSPI